MVDWLLYIGSYVLWVLVIVAAFKWIRGGQRDRVATIPRPRKNDKTQMAGSLIAMTLITAHAVERGLPLPLSLCLLIWLVPVPMIGFGFWLHGRKW